MGENFAGKPELGPTPVNILEDFADVVYSYKCKFCDFRSESTDAITSHVLNSHISQENKTLEKNLEQDNLQNTEKIIDLNDGPPLDPVSIDCTEEHEGSHSVNAYTAVDTQIEPSLLPEKQQIGSVQSTNQIIYEAPQTSLGDENIIKTNASTGTSTDADVVDCETQEVFVCGQCGNGFSSIQECKSHMIGEHNIEVSDKDNENPSEVTEFIPPNKVSVGTQAELIRRPGRKKKEETEKAEEEKMDEDVQHLELTDLSLLTPRMTTGSGKRVVRPPKKLMQDYYISKPKHTVKRRQVNRLTCPTDGCSLKFRLKEALDVHVKTHIIEETSPSKKVKHGFKCIECDKVTEQWKALQLHMWSAHQLDTDLCKCKLCDFRADSWQKVDIHAEKHYEEAFDCPRCDKTFKCSKSLRKHLEDHDKKATPDADDDNDTSTPATTCKTCGRNFVTKKSLKKHIELLHDKVKPFVCSYCGYSTGRKATLQLHIRTHTGDKPFKCDMCTYQTGDHNTLRRHRMRHTGSRPYQCQFCPYQCIQSISLKTHMKNKHPGVDMHLCSQCPYHTVNKSLFEQHQEDHKRGLIEQITGKPAASNSKSTSVVTKLSPSIKSEEGKPVTVYQSPAEAPRVNEASLKVTPSNMISIAAKEADLIDNQDPTVVNLQVAADPASVQADVNMFVLETQGGEVCGNPSYIAAETYVNDSEQTGNRTGAVAQLEPRYLLSQDPSTKEYYITLQAPDCQSNDHDQNPRLHGQMIEVVNTEDHTAGHTASAMILDTSNDGNFIYTVSTDMHEETADDAVTMVTDDAEMACEEAGAGLQHIITAIQNIAD